MTKRSTRQPDPHGQAMPGRARGAGQAVQRPAPLELVPAKLTDVGRARPHNEDYVDFLIPEDPEQLETKGRLFLVADGMGGHQAGEVASKGAVEAVINGYYQDTVHDPPASLKHAFRHANEKLFAQSQADPSKGGMGTTLVAAAILGARVYVANVGDSRAYIIDGQRIHQITKDHSWVEEQVRAGLLTPEQARRHPQRNLVTRALGSKPVVEVDLFKDEIATGQTLLLCTDGLTGRVSDAEIAEIVRNHPPPGAMHTLIGLANERGGNDNITVLLVRAADEMGSAAAEREAPGERVGRPGAQGAETRRTWAWTLAAAVVLLVGLAAVAVAMEWVRLPSGRPAISETSQPAIWTVKPPSITSTWQVTATTTLAATAPGATRQIATLTPVLATAAPPTVVSTATAGAPPFLYDAPILNEPTEGQAVRGLTTFSWIHTGKALAEGHVYKLLIWPTESGDVSQPVATESTTATSHEVPLDEWLDPGKQYSWIVVIANEATGDFQSPTEPSHTFLYQGTAGD